MARKNKTQSCQGQIQHIERLSATNAAKEKHASFPGRKLRGSDKLAQLTGLGRSTDRLIQKPNQPRLLSTSKNSWHGKPNAISQLKATFATFQSCRKSAIASPDPCSPVANNAPLSTLFSLELSACRLLACTGANWEWVPVSRRLRGSDFKGGRVGGGGRENGLQLLHVYFFVRWTSLLEHVHAFHSTSIPLVVFSSDV